MPRLRPRLALVLVSLSLSAGCKRAPSETTSELPALSQTEPADVELLCAEPSRTWAVLDPGGAIAAHTRGGCLGVVEHPEDGRLWQFVAQYQAHGAERLGWELHTWLDREGHPRHAEFRTPTVVTRFSWREGELWVRRLGDSLRVPEARELWITPNHGIYLRELMLRLGVGRSAQGQALVQRGFVPELDRISELEFELERVVDDLDHDRAQGHAGAGVLSLEGARTGLGGLHIQSLSVADEPRYWLAEATPLGPSLPAVPTPRYHLPEGLALSPIEILGDPGQPVLAGELVTLAPEPGAEPPPLRPGVLFINGAGPQDRRGFVPDSPVDIGSHELQDTLAAAGFAVLRFDDRGVGQSKLGDDPTPGFDALVDDARRAWASLARHPEVDPNRLILIGHGEGALVASILAGEPLRVGGRKRKLEALIVLAAPGRNLRELVYDEIRASLVGHREGEIRTAVDRARRVHDAALADEDLPASSEGSRRWMVEAFARDPLAHLAKVRAPILAVQGGKDFQVSPERDFEAIRELLETRGPKRSAAMLLPELDYLFKYEPGVSTPGHYGDLRRHVDAELITVVLAWLDELS